METHELVCISCPVGCALTVEVDGENTKTTGNQCRLGSIYGAKEVMDPRRIITTSVKVYNDDRSRYEMLSVKTNHDVPKNLIFDCLKAIQNVNLCGNINVGDIIIENILDLHVDIVATRPVKWNIS